MYGAIRKMSSETDCRINIAWLDIPAVFELRVQALQRVVADRALGTVANQNKPIALADDLNAQT